MSEAALERAAEASRAALVAVESAARVKLAATVATVNQRTRRTIAAGRAPNDVALFGAHLLEREVAADLVTVRGAARRASAATLADEMRAAGVASLPLPRRPSTASADAVLAGAAAKSFSAAWLTSALGSVGSEEGPNPQTSRIEGVATTAAAEAFSAERSEVMDAHAAEARLRGVPIPFKRWDATLDRRTCPRCARLDGTVQLWGLDFLGSAVPGRIHPRCRCVQGLVIMPIGWRSTPSAAA